MSTRPTTWPSLLGGQDREEGLVDPVALRLLGEHAVDEDGERPGLEQADADRDADQDDEDRDPARVGPEVGHRAAVEAHRKHPALRTATAAETTR